MRSPSLRADDERGELRGAAHRAHAGRVDALDDVGARDIGRLADRLGACTSSAGGSFCARISESARLGAEVARPDLGDPVGIRLLDAALRAARRRDPEALREPAHDGVRERHGALAAGGAHELDRVVDDGVHRLVGPGELVGAEPKRGSHRRVELAHGPLAELLDPEVDRALALHRPVREALRERAVAVVETLDGRGERAIGVGVLLEDAAHDLERGAPRRRDHRTPRRNSS